MIITFEFSCNFTVNFRRNKKPKTKMKYRAGISAMIYVAKRPISMEFIDLPMKNVHALQIYYNMILMTVFVFLVMYFRLVKIHPHIGRKMVPLKWSPCSRLSIQSINLKDL